MVNYQLHFPKDQKMTTSQAVTYKTKLVTFSNVDEKNRKPDTKEIVCNIFGNCKVKPIQILLSLSGDVTLFLEPATPPSEKTVVGSKKKRDV